MKSTRVLLIEDDNVFADLMTRFLQNRGYKVTLAADGESGLEACQNDDPDIVLCDLNLPQMSGLQILQKLVEDCSQVPVIVISGSERMSDIREAVRLGAWDYLVKPVGQLETIDLAIQNCLTRSSLEDSWERERWELDDHIDVLFDNQAVTQRLTKDLIPQGDLAVGSFVISHHLSELSHENYWLDYYKLPGNQAMAVIASAQAVAGQTLISLLVLKTLFNPLLRLSAGGDEDLLKYPHKVLEHLNAELCHSKIKTAFDLIVVWIDGDSGAIHWGHAGDSLKLSVESKPDLAVGIWSHASYSFHQGKLTAQESLRIGDDLAWLNISRRNPASPLA
ncbi:response regulator [Aliidiomarina minuta]|uniref:Response regulator n=1 Tax=Aliidiomarina minuta TaxID=880057 RepID=A0A432W8G7_9GAMM|nr:response regulator [Aliidiomarina minuta]RUO26349.1 response regulator [Aliidiomarina minuta]